MLTLLLIVFVLFSYALETLFIWGLGLLIIGHLV